MCRNGCIIRLFLVVLFVVCVTPSSFAQIGAERVKTDSIQLGLSSVSVKSIQALALSFDYPITDYLFDSASDLMFVSGKQQDEQSGQMLVKGFFAAIDKKDKVKWIVESSLYDLELQDKYLIVSNEERSVRFNKLAGYDELKYPGRVVITLTNTPFALVYHENNKDELQCLDLRTGMVKWTARIPGVQDWVDYKMLNDSVLLIAAAGLHAVNINKGFVWTLPLQTSVFTSKSLIYSLAKNATLSKVSRVVHTSQEENQVTQLASNILLSKGRVIMASKNSCLALDEHGKELWNLDLRNYPISKMMLSESDSSILLVNFGLAMHSDRFVNWGRPFILELNPADGKILNQFDLSKIENLADFIQVGNTLVFAGKDDLLEVKPGEPELKTILSLNQNSYGRFVEFINGDEYYIFTEGHFVPLNFINGNLIYFKTDNNKVYGIDGDFIQYEYHFTELYRYQGTFDAKTILMNERNTILISENYELLFELFTSGSLLLADDKMYFVEKNRLLVLDKINLR